MSVNQQPLLLPLGPAPHLVLVNHPRSSSHLPKPPHPHLTPTPCAPLATLTRLLVLHQHSGSYIGVWLGLLSIWVFICPPRPFPLCYFLTIPGLTLWTWESLRLILLLLTLIISQRVLHFDFVQLVSLFMFSISRLVLSLFSVGLIFGLVSKGNPLLN